MKKTLVMVAIAMGLAWTASALPAVTLDDDCELAAELTGFGYDMWIMILQGAEIDELVPVLYSNPEDVDLEDPDYDLLVPLPSSEVDIDTQTLGIPDVAQLALLGAATCADTQVAAENTANMGAAIGLMTKLEALVAWADGAASLTADATAIGAAAAQVGQVDAEAGALLAALAQGVGGFAQLLLPQINSSSGTAEIVGGLSDLAPIIGAEAGLSAEFNYVLSTLLASLLEDLGAPVNAPGTPFNGMTPVQICTYLEGNLTTAAGLATGLGQATLATLLTNTAAKFTAGITAMNNAMTPPVFAVVDGVAKAGNGPFSALGDYDGDGTNNLTIWTRVNGAGGTIADFVGGASGATDFYPGNPDLPAAGLIGLAALVSAIAGGGAFVLRKK